MSRLSTSVPRAPALPWGALPSSSSASVIAGVCHVPAKASGGGFPSADPGSCAHSLLLWQSEVRVHMLSTALCQLDMWPGPRCHPDCVGSLCPPGLVRGHGVGSESRYNLLLLGQGTGKAHIDKGISRRTYGPGPSCSAETVLTPTRRRTAATCCHPEPAPN